MSGDLASCPQRLDRATSTNVGGAQSLVHLRMQDAYGGTYWLDAEVLGTATLADIDSYLRAIRLECCGHISPHAGPA